MNVSGNDGASLMPSRSELSERDSSVTPGLTVPQLAKRFRVSPDKVRGWIKRGELAAINTADRRCARPRYVVTPDALAAFERNRQAQVAEPPKPERHRRRRRQANFVDFFPD